MTDLTTKKRTVSFDTREVRATLNGKMSLMLRAMKPRPPQPDEYQASPAPTQAFFKEALDMWWLVPEDVAEHDPYPHTLYEYRCPYGQPGDLLCVRESVWWPPRPTMNFIHYAATPRLAKGHKDGTLTHFYGIYPSDGEAVDDLIRDGYKKIPPSQAPLSASRLGLEITGVRAQRLGTLSDADARAVGLYQWASSEKPSDFYYGIELADVWGKEPRKTLMRLWDTQKRNRAYPAASNPWVWVIEFKLNLEALSMNAS